MPSEQSAAVTRPPLPRRLLRGMIVWANAPGTDSLLLLITAVVTACSALFGQTSTLLRAFLLLIAVALAAFAADTLGLLRPMPGQPALNATTMTSIADPTPPGDARRLVQVPPRLLPVLTPLVIFSAGVLIGLLALIDHRFMLRLALLGTLAIAAAIAGLRLASSLESVDDLTTEVQAQRRDLSRQALHDPLTGQASRPLFTHCLEAALRDPHNATIAVLMCDLNAFKSINDDLGHAVGDSLLAQVAWQLHRHLPPGATLARTGADEFGVLLENLQPTTAQGAAESVALELETSLDSPFMVDGREISAAMTVGIVIVHPSHEALDVDEVLRRADIALQTARRSHSRTPVLYVDGLSLPEAQDWQLRPAVAQALRSGGIIPYYQPVVDLTSGAIHAFEALARWERPESSSVGPQLPDIFLPVITRAGLLPLLTDRMVVSSAQQLSTWRESVNGSELKVTVNVSPASIVDPSFPDQIHQLLAEHDLVADGLIVEITEEKLLDDLDAAEGVLRNLRDLGVHIWLDDFGAGYSSLAMLHRLPLDAIKLDKGLIRTLDTDTSLRRMVGGLLSLSADLDIAVVAEGIQRFEQVQVLRDLGCPLGQGYLFAPPVRAQDCLGLLQRRGVTSIPTNWADGGRRALAAPSAVTAGVTELRPERSA